MGAVFKLLHVGSSKEGQGQKNRFFRSIFLAKNRFSVLMEKKFGWKNRLKKNRGKIAKNRRFFGNGRFLADFSALAIHAPGRRVRVARGVDLSAIKAKYRRFFGDFYDFFRLFLPDFSGP